jgi:hypothetical protein
MPSGRSALGAQPIYLLPPRPRYRPAGREALRWASARACGWGAPRREYTVLCCALGGGAIQPVPAMDGRIPPNALVSKRRPTSAARRPRCARQAYGCGWR